MELVPGIACIWEPLVLGRSRSLKEQAPGARKVQTFKKWETVRPSAPKYRESEKSETCTFRCQSRFQHFHRFPWIVSRNRPVIPSLNIVIITWRRLGYNVIVFKDGPHFQVQSQIHLCIQSFTGVKKRFVPCKLTQTFLLVHCSQPIRYRLM